VVYYSRDSFRKERFAIGCRLKWLLSMILYSFQNQEAAIYETDN
jgi:hypothetical protein